ncbi:class I SAM-dependent methyltransferase [Aromatoleum toluvorans]
MSEGIATAHVLPAEASAWVRRFMPLVAPGGTVLDHACGGGRHARLFAAQGFRVVAVDRSADALAALAGVPGVETRCEDLEGASWPFAGQCFDAVVVTNYLFRPRFGDLLACVAPGGVLIYETFMLGNERFGRPSSPEFLLRPGELLERIGAGFTVVAFEQGVVARPRAAVVQRVCAVRRAADSVELPIAATE